MAVINLTSDDLKTLSRHMLKWKEDLSSLNSRLRSQILTMDGWRDPQFAMFLNAIEMTSAQIETYARNMEAMAKGLNVYANQQNEMNAQFRSQISSIQ